MLTISEKLEGKNGYLEIADFIESKIVSGELKYNDKLPDTAGLMELFSVSRDTIQRSLTRLTDKGLVKRAPRRGTFVTARVYSRNIGLVLGKNPFFDPSIFYLSMLTEFNQLAKEFQLNPKTYFILDENNVFQSMYELENDLKEGNLKCLIPVFMSGVLGRWLEHWDDIPIIFPPEGDYRDSTYIGVKHLIEKGYKNIKIISIVANDKETHPFVVHLRQEEIDGMQLAIDEVNPDATISGPCYCGVSEKDAYDFVKSIFMDSENAPDAILLNHDVKLRGVLFALMEMGLKIPDDVALISHFNKGYDLFSPVKLTKIQVDPKDYVIKTLEYLRNNTFTLPASRQTVPGKIKAELIQGEST